MTTRILTEILFGYVHKQISMVAMSSISGNIIIAHLKFSWKFNFCWNFITKRDTVVPIYYLCGKKQNWYGHLSLEHWHGSCISTGYSSACVPDDSCLCHGHHNGSPATHTSCIITSHFNCSYICTISYSFSQRNHFFLMLAQKFSQYITKTSGTLLFLHISTKPGIESKCSLQYVLYLYYLSEVSALPSRSKLLWKLKF